MQQWQFTASGVLELQIKFREGVNNYPCMIVMLMVLRDVPPFLKVLAVSTTVVINATTLDVSSSFCRFISKGGHSCGFHFSFLLLSGFNCCAILHKREILAKLHRKGTFLKQATSTQDVY